MGFNLGNERIQNSYPQLVQISGSTLVDGTGSAIPAITNINSVSSSYAVSASYADYAVSASYEIVHEVSSSYAETASFADFATSAGTSTSATTATSASHALYANQAGSSVSATTSTSASHALFANQAGTATSATTAATASYIDPTFISASAAASGFGSGGGDPFPYTGTALINGEMIITSSAKTDVGVDVSYTAFAPFARTARITPEGFQTLNASGEVRIKIGGSSDAGQISSSYFNTENYSVGPNNYGLWSAGRDGVVIFDRYPSPRVQLAALGDNATYGTSVYINPKLVVDGTITASIISASSGFVGNGSGLTNIAQVGQNKFFEENTYTFDLPGDTTSIYDIHISQSGTYFLSASSTPAGVQGPRVNLYYWPELIGVGETAKVKFFIPSGDTLAGIQYKENITGSASNEWYWPSTTSPASTATRSITRNATFKQISVGTGGTTMTKDGNGRVFIATSTGMFGTNNYLYTGDSTNPLI